MYELGWEQTDYDDDNPMHEWRCSKCKRLKHLTDCGMCKRCEHCFQPCSPDTEAGQQAVRDYVEKGGATVDFDIFGEPFDG
jgi:hypothetical protein